jgi:hypothetical protein
MVATTDPNVQVTSSLDATSVIVAAMTTAEKATKTTFKAATTTLRNILPGVSPTSSNVAAQNIPTALVDVPDESTSQQSATDLVIILGASIGGAALLAGVGFFLTHHNKNRISPINDSNITRAPSVVNINVASGGVVYVDQNSRVSTSRPANFDEGPSVRREPKLEA